MKLSTLIAFAASLLLMCSCNSTKNSLVYFEDIEGLEQCVIAQQPSEIVIRPSDELSIVVNSIVPMATAPFNKPLVNAVNSAQASINSQNSFQTYIVDSNGDIDMPVLGKIHVAGMSVEKLTEYITQRVSETVKDPMVTVTLLNFYVKVMGEVAKPGSYTKENGKTTWTVLDALSAAGDMTPFSDRSKVMVLRREGDRMVYHKLDFNDTSALESPYFYLQQDDVVIVPPTKVRQDNAEYNTNNSYKIQIASTVVSVVSVIASLVISLTVR